MRWPWVSRRRYDDMERIYERTLQHGIERILSRLDRLEQSLPVSVTMNYTGVESAEDVATRVAEEFRRVAMSQHGDTLGGLR